MSNSIVSVASLFSTANLPEELAKRIESRKASPFNDACQRGLDALVAAKHEEAFTLAGFIQAVFNYHYETTGNGVFVKDAAARNFLNAAKADGELTSPTRQTYKLVLDDVPVDDVPVDDVPVDDVPVVE